MVGGQLHHEGRRVAGEHLRLFQHNAGEDDGRHADEVGGGGHPRAAAEDGSGDHGDKGHLGAAGDKRGGHNGHAPVALILDGAGRHDAGDTAAGADEHGDEALTGQAELAENTIQHEGDTRHIAARLQKCQQQEQHQHLGHEAQHRADARHNAVQDQTAEPVGGTGGFQRVADEHRHTGHPHAVVGGIRLLADLLQGGLRLLIVRHRRRLGGDSQRLLVLHVVGEFTVGGHAVLRRVEVVAHHQLLRVAVPLGQLAVPAVDTQQVPAVAEQPVVCPVGSGGTHRHHGDVVHKEHHRGEDRQTQPPVGHDPVDLVADGQLTGVFLLIARLDDLRDVHVPLVGDDALRIVVQLLLGSLDVSLDVVHGLGGDVQLRQHLVVPLEDLDGVPPLLLLRQTVDGCLLDVGDGVLHGAGERVHGHGLCLPGGGDGGLGGLHNALALQRGDLHDPAPQLPAQLLHVDPVAVLPHHVHHVDGDDHGDTQLRQLCGQIQIPLQIGAVDDVQNGVGTLLDQIVPRHHLLQRVGGQGVDARQVHNAYVVVLFQLALFLLHRHARPVAHELVGARQRVEQGGFPGVGIACQRDLDLFFHITSPFG